MNHVTVNGAVWSNPLILNEFRVDVSLTEKPDG